jgi:hypothetical protein
VNGDQDERPGGRPDIRPPLRLSCFSASCGLAGDYGMSKGSILQAVFWPDFFGDELSRHKESVPRVTA